MPIYEYVCQDCGYKFEAIRSFQDADAQIPCSKCLSASTKRTISVFYAQSNGRVIAGNSNNACTSCSGGNCSSCGH